MTYAPSTLTDLGRYWTSQGGVNLGIVGDTRHTKGYHLGRDRIYDGTGPGIGDADYSVQLARDKAGLTNAASAIDLGRLNGSLTALWDFSAWLAGLCMKRDPACADIREVIFWDQKSGRVVGWSSKAPDRLIPDYGDSSHKTHTHISWFRDSENRSRSKTDLVRRYFEEGGVGLKLYLTATKDANPWDDFGTAKLRTGAIQRVSDGASVALAAGTNLGTVQVGTVNGQAVVSLNHAGEQHVAPRANVDFIAIAPPAGPADCTDKVTAAYAEGKTAGINEANAACAPKVAAADAAGYKRGVTETKAKAKAVHTVSVTFDG
jgi:hypothetical protein